MNKTLRTKEDNVKRIIDRIQGRKININLAMKFEKPEYISILNSAIRDIEQRKRKKYSIKNYNNILEMFHNDKLFIKSCEFYLNNSDRCTKPKLTFIQKHDNLKKRYDINNLKVAKLKNRKFYDLKHTLKDEMVSINRNMKNPVGYDFLCQFDDADKIRFLLLCIKNHNKKLNFNFTAQEKRDYLSKFYYDENFNRFYDEYILTGNKFIKPSLDHKIPRSRGGDNSLDNLHFISFLENNAKNNMTLEEWNITKENLNKYFI